MKTPGRFTPNMCVCHVTLHFVTSRVIAHTKFSNSDNSPVKDVVKPCWSQITSLVATRDFRMAFLITKRSKIKKHNYHATICSSRCGTLLQHSLWGGVINFSCFHNHQVNVMSKYITGAFYPKHVCMPRDPQFRNFLCYRPHKNFK